MHMAKPVKLVNELYEPLILPARQRFARTRALGVIVNSEPLFLELFLIQFSSLGVALTTPVEDWLVRAGQCCDDAGLPDIGRALRSHSRQEAGHHLMMIEDTHALVAHWNARHSPTLDADELLAREPSPGGRLYQELHEDNIAGETPYAQVAIEYEIELLPVQFGPVLLKKCAATLGSSIVERLSFLREHITLDVAHTRFNEQLLEKLLETDPGYLTPLVHAGERALDAYAAFLNDCVCLAGAPFAQPLLAGR
jgi:hypothetical protein